MPLIPAFFMVALAPVQDTGTGAWRALPTPAMCRTAPPGIDSPRLVRGTHLVISKEDVEAGLGLAPSPAFSVSAFASLLSEEARRESWGITLHPSSPPLLVQGSQAGCQAAATFCEQLDAASRGLDVELSVWLVRGAGVAAAGAGLPKEAPWAFTRLRSGAESMLGERSIQSYVHNYSVEVATDAGVAAPVVGRVLTGDVLHVRAMRVRAGSGVFVEGLLDLSRLTSLEDFELSATDLGSVQQPHVNGLQIAFSGTVASGAPLRLAWAGLGGSEAVTEGSLWIVPRAIPDAADGRWRMLDTALVEALAWDLPPVSPGGGLEGAPDGTLEDQAPKPLAGGLLIKEAETSRSSLSRSRPLFVAGSGVVLGPRAEQDGWAEIDSLRGVAEALRTKTHEVLVARGAGFVRLPVAGGSTWRVLVCDETTAVVDYDVEIAPETWMPGPRVERSLDGFCAQGLAGTDFTSYSAWVAATSEKHVAERSSVPLGRLELPRRTWRSARGEARAGAAPEVLLPGAAPLTMSVRAL